MKKDPSIGKQGGLRNGRSRGVVAEEGAGTSAQEGRARGFRTLACLRDRGDVARPGGAVLGGLTPRLGWTGSRATLVGIAVLFACLLTLPAAGSARAAVNFGDVNQIEMEPVGLDKELVPVSIVSGKFDDDADPDLAVAAGDRLRILRGAKKGTFKLLRKPVLRSRFGGFTQVVTAPVNADGRPDLIALESSFDFFETYLITLLGEGEGEFRVASRVEQRVGAIAAGDLDGDGDADLVAAGVDGVQTFLGDGTGGLAPEATYPNEDEVKVGPAGFAVTNLDPGPSLDVVIVGFDGGVQSLLNDGTGGFTPGPTVSLPGECCLGPHGFDVGDLNGDAIADLAVGIEKTGGGPIVIHTLLGDGAGGFAEHAAVEVLFTFSPIGGPDAVRLADVNRDGRLDLLSSNDFPGAFAVLLGDGGGGFASQVDFASPQAPTGLVSDDFNGDGDPDVATATSWGFGLPLLLATFLSRRGQVKCSGKPADFVGFSAREVRSTRKRGPRLSDAPVGGPGDEVVSAGAGSDFVWPQGGDDTVCAGAGNDRLGGGKGSDLLIGGRGSDRINGGPGKDHCLGGLGKDKFNNCEKIRR